MTEQQEIHVILGTQMPMKAPGPSPAIVKYYEGKIRELVELIGIQKEPRLIEILQEKKEGTEIDFASYLKKFDTEFSWVPPAGVYRNPLHTPLHVDLTFSEELSKEFQRLGKNETHGHHSCECCRGREVVSPDAEIFTLLKEELPSLLGRPVPDDLIKALTRQAVDYFAAESKASITIDIKAASDEELRQAVMKIQAELLTLGVTNGSGV